jgi:hypothetical protein
MPPPDINDVLNAGKYTSDTYVGISGKMLIREKELEYAKFHIANQIAIRDRCIVDEGMVFVYGTNRNYSAIDSNFDYDDSYISDIMDYIEVCNVYVFNDFSVVIARDMRRIGQKNYHIARNSNVAPEWTTRPPVIDGYYVGVGKAEKYSLPYKGVIVADVNAAQQIAAEINAFTSSFFKDTIREGVYNYSETVQGAVVLVKAELQGFYILDRWIDRDGSFYYSLGIAKK